MNISCVWIPTEDNINGFSSLILSVPDGKDLNFGRGNVFIKDANLTK